MSKVIKKTKEENKIFPLDKRLEYYASKKEIIDAINILLDERKDNVKEEVEELKRQLDIALNETRVTNQMYFPYPFHSFIEGQYSFGYNSTLPFFKG